MRPRFLIVSALLVGALAAPLASLAGGETSFNSYDVFQVAPSGVYGRGLNDAGHVAGTAWAGESQRAFLWREGVFTDLGTLGGAESGALAVNNLDQVVGGFPVPCRRAARVPLGPGRGDARPGHLGRSLEHRLRRQRRGPGGRLRGHRRRGRAGGPVAGGAVVCTSVGRNSRLTLACFGTGIQPRNSGGRASDSQRRSVSDRRGPARHDLIAGLKAAHHLGEARFGQAQRDLLAPCG
jgi:probable HAF family extracellular repeat protein